MLPEYISGVVRVLFSLGFEFVPGVQEWYDKLDPRYKKLHMIGLGLVVVAVGFGFSCAELFGAEFFVCDEVGAQEAVKSFVAFLLANQATYALVLHKPSG